MPTVEGVDFPNLGICEAFNNVPDNTLHVSTYTATAAQRGQATSWKVTQLPNPKAAQVYCDGEKYSDWGVIDDHSIEINSSIAAHRFRIVSTATEDTASGESGATSTRTPATTTASSTGTEAETNTQYRPASPPSCRCC